jgi:hypothetical protein
MQTLTKDRTSADDLPFKVSSGIAAMDDNEAPTLNVSSPDGFEATGFKAQLDKLLPRVRALLSNSGLASSFSVMCGRVLCSAPHQSLLTI